MSHLLSLIAAPGSLTAPHVERARAAAASTAAPCWLARGEACEFAIAGAPLAPLAALAAARRALADIAVDVNLVPAEGRRKRLLVADMESTLIENEMIDDLAAMAGAGERVAAITRRAMNGELDFAAALRERVALLAGLAEARLAEAATRIRIIPGARSLVATMRAHGAYTAIVPGGFRVFTAEIRDGLGFDHHEANELEIRDGRLVGRVREPILDREAKRAILDRLAAERGLVARDAIAVGDGANDIPMLLAAGLGVAFRGKPAVAAATPLAIRHGDLAALLFLQGYRREDFVMSA